MEVRATPVDLAPSPDCRSAQKRGVEDGSSVHETGVQFHELSHQAIPWIACTVAVGHSLQFGLEHLQHLRSKLDQLSTRGRCRHHLDPARFADVVVPKKGVLCKVSKRYQPMVSQQQSVVMSTQTRLQASSALWVGLHSFEAW